jgi:hypothetical protein
MIKSEKIIKNQEKKKNQYPCLMYEKHNDMIVFFSNPSVGTVVYASDSSRYSVGSHRADWFMGSFVIFDGEIKLKNEE